MSANPEQKMRQKPVAGNWTIAAACVVFVASMVGMSYAAVPLYELFCRVTGYNGTVRQAEQMSNVILDQTIRVEFDANAAPELQWDFKPEVRGVDIRIGETVQVNFKVTNTWREAGTGEAVFNVTPMQAGAYFNKVQCFCFTDVTLKPGETKELPVVFFVDPAIVEQAETKGVSTITLSYTFYAKKVADKPVAANAGTQETTDNL